MHTGWLDAIFLFLHIKSVSMPSIMPNAQAEIYSFYAILWWWLSANWFYPENNYDDRWAVWELILLVDDMTPQNGMHEPSTERLIWKCCLWSDDISG